MSDNEDLLTYLRSPGRDEDDSDGCRWPVSVCRIYSTCTSSRRTTSTWTARSCCGRRKFVPSSNSRRRSVTSWSAVERFSKQLNWAVCGVPGRFTGPSRKAPWG